MSRLPFARSQHQGRAIGFAAAALLCASLLLSFASLVQENPTIDEVIHLPAGITYWESGSYRMYPHNPPLVKLIAALPVLAANPVTQPLYASAYWAEEPPSKAGLGHLFAQSNARHYLELFTSARVLMPLWSVVGGLAVFFWSKRLYGPPAGLLSLFLWCFCPNILAHARLVTTDIPAASLGIAATYAFRRSLEKPTWQKALGVGALLGLAQLTKYSLLILFLVWPIIWLIRNAFAARLNINRARIQQCAAHTLVTLLACVLTINLGYRFEGTGRPLGSFPFTCATLTKPRPTPLLHQPRPTNPFDRIREYRVNRFQNTPLAALPVPLPRYYLLGFDDQKLEAEGIPTRFLLPPEVGDRMGAQGDRVIGYPVYLNGRLRSQSWSEYYLFCLLYKLPEGTLLLLAAAFLLLFLVKRPRAAWAEEIVLLLVPAIVLLAMSLGTNINLGLRYVLPALPYLFVFTGKIIPGIASRTSARFRNVAFGLTSLALASNLLAVALIFPHYLAYFNRIAGGPEHGSEHLIDSNIDWGQDLVGLERWARRNLPPEESLGIAYFGQINPAIFALRGEPLNWYLPPVRNGALRETPASHRPGAPGATLRPGWYAISASLLRGLEWRVYDPARWAPYAAGRDAFSYFQNVQPAGSIGHSILLFRLSPAEAAALEKLRSQTP